jgi:serine protease Do
MENSQAIRASRPPRPSRQRLPFAAAAALAIFAAMSLTGPAPSQAQLNSSEAPAFSPVLGAPPTFADLVARVKPSVVSIQVVAGGESRPRRSTRRRSPGGTKPFPDLPDDHPLNEFFRGMPRGEGTPRARPTPRRRAQGSGFVISADGYVVTNNHVIAGAQKIVVSFDEKEKIPAELVGTDPRTDLALLKIKSDKQFPYVRFAKEESREGDWVVAVGNPFGLGGTVTAGIVSALARDIGSGPYDFLQIDAAVNRGNSGGPTFNLKGEVIGVNTAIYSPSGGNVGIAFAVPAKTAVEVIEELKKNGSVQRGWLGVKIQSITEDMAEGLGLPDDFGALVNDVTKDSPAEAAGLRSGDAITAVNDRRIEDSRDLARKIADYSPGTTVKVKVRRADRDMTIDVKLGRFPSTNPQVAMQNDDGDDATPTALEELGLSLRTNDGGEGVLIEDVDNDSDAAEKGLRQGDVIVEVNSRKVSNPADIDEEVSKARKRGRKAVLMVVKRGGQRRFVAVQFMEKKS